MSGAAWTLSEKKRYEFIDNNKIVKIQNLIFIFLKELFIRPNEVRTFIPVSDDQKNTLLTSAFP